MGPNPFSFFLKLGLLAPFTPTKSESDVKVFCVCKLCSDSKDLIKMRIGIGQQSLLNIFQDSEGMAYYGTERRIQRTL